MNVVKHYYLQHVETRMLELYKHSWLRLRLNRNRNRLSEKGGDRERLYKVFCRSNLILIWILFCSMLIATQRERWLCFSLLTFDMYTTKAFRRRLFSGESLPQKALFFLSKSLDQICTSFSHAHLGRFLDSRKGIFFSHHDTCLNIIVLDSKMSR